MLIISIYCIIIVMFIARALQNYIQDMNYKVWLYIAWQVQVPMGNWQALNLRNSEVLSISANSSQIWAVLQSLSSQELQLVISGLCGDNLHPAEVQQPWPWHVRNHIIKETKSKLSIFYPEIRSDRGWLIFSVSSMYLWIIPAVLAEKILNKEDPGVRAVS